jgi:LAO/AO transport system kinase
MKKDYSDIENLKEGLLQGDRLSLSKAITLIESTKTEDRKKADQLLDSIIKNTGNSIRIGISGVPGVGKSTFIEAFGLYVLQQNKKVAVLAVDPSSSTAKGSILGDKTRMQELSANKNAFIRPSPSSGNLGGVARKTRESILLCEAAGYDIILVETVGVGQSEITVSGMVDFFLLLMIAGAGDELQGIKRGIMEIADLVLVNKADGDNLPRAKAARQDYGRALHLFQAKESGWIPLALTCSSIENIGIKEVSQEIEKYQNHTKTNGYFASNRKRQALNWFKEMFSTSVQELLLEFSTINATYESCLEAVKKEKMTPGSALQKIKEAIRQEFLKSSNN